MADALINIFVISGLPFDEYQCVLPSDTALNFQSDVNITVFHFSILFLKLFLYTNEAHNC